MAPLVLPRITSGGDWLIAHLGTIRLRVYPENEWRTDLVRLEVCHAKFGLRSDGA
jgi:hypothetical protein